MYGKIFASTFTGSLFGVGPVKLAVWAYVLANAGPLGRVELNPALVAAALGAELSDVENAIAFLAAPDSRSRSKVEDGRRLVQEDQFEYRIVNFHVYRSIRNSDERREYNRLKQREWREKHNPPRQDVSRGASLTVIDSQDVSAQDRRQKTEELLTTLSAPTGAGRAKRSKKKTPQEEIPYSTDFEEFWKVYPVKLEKSVAWTAWQEVESVRPQLSDLVASVLAHIASDEWTKDGGRWIPRGKNFLRGKRWEDEVAGSRIERPPKPGTLDAFIWEEKQKAKKVGE